MFDEYNGDHQFILLSIRRQRQMCISNSPNIVIGDKGFSPLRTVIVFACVDHVEMRDVLLSYGARETKEDRESWQRRRLVEKNEAAWLQNRHKEDRVG